MIAIDSIALLPVANLCYVDHMAGRRARFPPIKKNTDGTFTVVLEDRSTASGSYGNRYRCRWWYRGLKRKEKRFKDTQEGVAFFDAIWRSYQLGTLDGQEHARPKSFSEAIDVFSCRVDLSPRTKFNYAHTLGRFADHAGRSRQIQNIYTSDVQSWLKTFDPSISPHSLARYTRELKAFFNYAVKWGWIPVNPASPIVVKQPKPKIAYIPRHHWDLFLHHCSPAHRIRCRFLLWTGIRTGELLHARWSWIEPTATGLIFKIQDDLETNWRPKWNAQRHIPLAAPAIEALDQARANWTRSDFIFGNHLLTSWNSNRETRAACALAGIDRVKTHALRASFATYMLTQGVDMLTLARLLGHKDTKMLQAHYAGFSTKHLQDTIKRIDELEATQETTPLRLVTASHDEGA